MANTCRDSSIGIIILLSTPISQHLSLPFSLRTKELLLLLPAFVASRKYEIVGSCSIYEMEESVSPVWGARIYGNEAPKMNDGLSIYECQT